MNIGKEIYNFATSIFDFHRHLMGDGVRNTLYAIKKIVPKLKIYEIKSGTKFYDWTIPLEWKVYEAYISTLDNKKIIDIKNNNLHIVQYSDSVNAIIDIDRLKKKLHYIEKLPNAIPYLTSYYKKDWGFCLSYNQYKKLNKKKYKVVIKSKKFKGSMTYGEILIAGKIMLPVHL